MLLPGTPQGWSETQLASHYEDLIKRLEVAPEATSAASSGRSALAELLTSLRTQWQAVSRSNKESEFLKWLETTATIVPANTRLSAGAGTLNETLDSLDSVLLAAIVEIESLAGASLGPAELEGKLAEIWRRCYAHYASDQEAVLGRWFLHRGQALNARIYPDPAERRRLYRSGLPPRQGVRLMELYPAVRQHLLTGVDYADRDRDGQFEFIRNLVELLGAHPKFELAAKTPPKTSWQDILRWWLDPSGPVTSPSAQRVSDWYNYVSSNFGYRFAWGVGCVLALAANEAHGDILQATTLDSWKDTGLPWIALWLKELIVWGTLDPVSAYLLGKSRAGTREEAANLAQGYLESQAALSADEKLNPSSIRSWADSLSGAAASATETKAQAQLKVKLERTFPKNKPRRWRVLPAVVGNRIQWVDPAGFVLASGDLPSRWDQRWLEDRDFLLDVDREAVLSRTYL